jgi:hypothetical protein
VGNYFSGQLAKLELSSGEFVATADTGVERSLAGIAEYRGDDSSLPAARVARKKRRLVSKRTLKKSSRKASALEKKSTKRLVARKSTARKKAARKK